MSETEFDYYKEKARYIYEHDLWDEKNEKTTKKVHDVFGIRNEKYDEKGGMYNAEQYVKGFTTKPIKFALCQGCLEELKDKQKQYCHHTCKQNLVELKKKFTELKKDDKDLAWIAWTKNPDGKPEWKDVKGIANVNGMYFSSHNIITKKSGKTRNKDY